MRFCPFCSAENSSEASHCQACVRKLPPLPPKKRTPVAVPKPEPAPAPPPKRALATPPPPTRKARISRPPPIAATKSGPIPAEPATTIDEGKPATTTDEGKPGDDEAPATEAAATPAPESVVVDTPEVAPAPAADEAEAPADKDPLPTPFSGRAGDDAHSWPAPQKPAPEPDPHDWGQPARTDDSGQSPPPTRVVARDDHEALGHRPIPVAPVPEVPESGVLPAAKYAISFFRARWQRRKAIKKLRTLIANDTTRLDAVLGRLGAEARALELRSTVLTAENEAIDAAERRRERADHDCAELSNRRADENARFAEIEQERQEKVAEAQKVLEKVEAELGSLEAQRRSLRDKRKAAERRQKEQLKAAEEREAEAEKATLGDQKTALREKAEELRRGAAKLDPERQDIERRLQALEKPMSQTLAKAETLRSDLESARRSLNDSKEGHRLRLSEIEAEQGRKNRELGQAEAEIQRRLITLGTLVNLNRIERPEFRDSYDQIDRLRGAIGSRTNEIDRLSAEREAYDKGAIVRGCVAIAGVLLALLTIILIISAAT